jgi:hypothetical protein
MAKEILGYHVTWPKTKSLGCPLFQQMQSNVKHLFISKCHMHGLVVTNRPIKYCYFFCFLFFFASFCVFYHNTKDTSQAIKITMHMHCFSLLSECSCKGLHLQHPFIFLFSFSPVKELFHSFYSFDV